MSEINVYSSIETPLSYPLLATRGLVVLPGTKVSFDVGRASSIKAVDEAMRTGKLLVLSSQKDIAVDEPDFEDIYTIGTLVRVKQVMRLAEDNIRILVKGVDRVSLLQVTKENGHLKTLALKLAQPDGLPYTVEHEASLRMLKDLFSNYCDYIPTPVETLSQAQPLCPLKISKRF